MHKVKTCNTCGKTKPEQQFKKRTRLCKDCRNAKERQHYQENKEVFQAKREANRERRNEISRASYARRIDYERRRSAEYRAKNAEKRKAYQRQRVQDLPDAYVAKVIRRRTGLTTQDVYQYPELIQAYRQYLITKRQIQGYEADQACQRLTAEHDRIIRANRAGRDSSVRSKRIE
jgi:hypothetical protein